MAFGRSYSSWRYRSRYGTRSTRRWNSGARKRAWGNARAARQQRDAATVTISRIATQQVVLASGTNDAAVEINHWNSLRLSTYFSNYAPMYDQMKIDKIRVKLTGNQAGSAMTSNISPAVVLAFDRNGLSLGQTLSSSTVSTYSSAQLKQWSTGNAFVMYQTIYPSTIMEKGQYIPTESLQDPSEEDVSTNPCYSLSDPTMPFKPVTLLAVDMGSTMTSDQTFAFTIEYEYTVTFRGMRKPSLSSSSFPTSLTRIDSIYEDITSNPQPIPETGWQSTMNLSYITVPSNYVLIADWLMSDNSHTIAFVANESSSSYAYSVASVLTSRQGYYILFDPGYSDSALYIGSKEVPFISNSFSFVSAATSIAETARFAYVYVYPGWE